MSKLLKQIDWVHKFATGATVLTYIMVLIGLFNKLPIDSAWMGLCKIIFIVSCTSYVLLFITMVINAIKK